MNIDRHRSAQADQSAETFALLGMNEGPTSSASLVNDEAGFAIFSADGTQVAVLPDSDVPPSHHPSARSGPASVPLSARAISPD